MLSTSGITARGVTMTNFVSLLGSIGGLGARSRQDRADWHLPHRARRLADGAASVDVTLAQRHQSFGAETTCCQTWATGRSLDSAVRDLGLKLTRQRELVDVLMIESVSQPDED